jgi:hypothetical protein
VKEIESGTLDLATFHHRLDEIQSYYADDEWAWVMWAYQQLTGVDLSIAEPEQLHEVADTLLACRQEFLEAVLADAVKEFDRHSAIGFGADGPDTALDDDFQAVRGDYDSNKFVTQLQAEIAQLGQRVAQFKERLAQLPSHQE